MDYERKIRSAIKLLQAIPTQDGPIEVSYSGGKDSDVILELAKMAGIPFEAIYKNTTIDPPGTVKHAKEMGATIINPRRSFMDLVRDKGCPSRFSRFCCAELKEYKVRERAIQGIRRCESTKRAQRYKEPEICRTYPKGEKARIYFPILEWTNEDVERFIKERGIKCAPVYYDKDGTFHVERRLGCIGCPLATDNGRGDFKKYPKLLRQYVRAATDYLAAHPSTRAAKVFHGDGAALVFRRLFFKNLEDYRNVVDGGLFPEMRVNPREYLQKYFGIDLTI